jgi:hypothetical protein
LDHPDAGKAIRRVSAMRAKIRCVFLFIADFACLNYEEIGIVLKEFNQTSRIALWLGNMI